MERPRGVNLTYSGGGEWGSCRKEESAGLGMGRKGSRGAARAGGPPSGYDWVVHGRAGILIQDYTRSSPAAPSRDAYPCRAS